MAILQIIDYETGDLSQLSYIGQQAGGVVSIHSGIPKPFAGQYCQKASIPIADSTRRAEGSSQYPRNMSEGFFGFAIYIPEDFEFTNDSEHCTIWQHKCYKALEADHFANLELRPDMTIRIRRNWSIQGAPKRRQILRELTFPLVKGQWHVFRDYLKRGDHGVYKLWYFDELVYENNDIDMNDLGPEWGLNATQFGLYSGHEDLHANVVYHDQLIIATTLEEADPRNYLPIEPCPEGYHRDSITGECVPDKPLIIDLNEIFRQFLELLIGKLKELAGELGAEGEV